MRTRSIRYCTIFLMFLFLVTAASAQDTKIMIINSYHAEYPWVVAHNTALRNGLEDTATLSFHYLDTKRRSLAVGRENAMALLESIKQNKPDIVVLTDDFALKELGLPTMNAGIPVVFLGINGNPRNYIGSMTLASGVLERPLLKRSIAYLKDILGTDMKKCLVLFDNGTTAKVIVETDFLGKQSSHFSKTKTDIKLSSTFAEWKDAVLRSKKRGYDVIILGLYHTLVDDEGNHVPDDKVAHWTSAHSPVPVFGFWDFSIGLNKAVGGLVLSGTPQGKEAVTIIKRILAGHSPRTIQPVTAEHGRFVFSRSGLQRWDITLPEYFNNPKEPIEFVE